jgi:hypothetical protein
MRKLTDGVTFSLQQGSPSQVESDEEDLAADKQMLALYDANPIKTEQEFGADAEFIQELREHVAMKMAMKNKPRAKKEDVSEVLPIELSAWSSCCVSLTVFGVTFSLQRGSPSEVESDEEDLAADKQTLALYDANPVK